MAAFKNEMENVYLTWTNHNSSLIKVVQELYDEESYCDCTLSADGDSFDCHRIVLSACSHLLHELIKSHPCDRPVIILDGINKAELRAIIEFIYTGATSIPIYLLSDFFETCKYLQITGLKDYELMTKDPESLDDIPDVDDPLPALDLLEPKLQMIEDDYVDASKFLLSDPSLSHDVLPDPQELYATDDVDDEGMIEVQFLNEELQGMQSDMTNDHQVVKIHDGLKRYQCPKCGNNYAHRRTLLHHLHWICNQPATYACKLCPYMGKRKFQLKSHIEHVHSRSLLIDKLRHKKKS